ncbi:MAG: ParB/RepB/Spo0J family partition protein [Actinomycetota bacterium]|nr:ParB/RepB/Spo0J family partition protein [Actinomycetota bacterium]
MNKRSGLGRGLDALLPPENSVPTASPFIEVDVDSVDPNPRQPRREFDEALLKELAASIRELGLLQPLVVRESGDRYELVAGERRLRALKLAGLQSAPALVVETDERGSLARALVENVHRHDLNPIEEASAYRQLIDDGGLTHEELGVKVAKNRTTISNALRLLELPVEIKRWLIQERLTAGHGRALLGLQGSPFQKRLAQRAAHEGLSVRETEDLVKRYSSMVSGPRRTRSSEAERPPLAVEAQRILAERLQTRVRVETSKRKGRIVLDFTSLEELQRLLGIIAPEGSTRTVTVALDEERPAS